MPVARTGSVRHDRLHDGRHTAATLLLSEGVHPRVVMGLLGHSQLRTTMDIDRHVMPALAREAADRVGSVLLGPAAPRALQLIVRRAAALQIRVELLMGYSKHPYLRIPDIPISLGRPSRRPARRIHAVERRLEPDVIAQIVAQYEAGAFTTELTGRFQLGKGTVLRLLRRHGVVIRRQSMTAEEVGESVQLYTDGWSLARIGRKFGREHTVIRDALIRSNVQLRPRPGHTSG